MKKTMIMAAMAAVVCTVACNKNTDVSVEPMTGNQALAEERFNLKVGIQGTWGTKSTTISNEDEVKVNTLQVLVFRGDALDAYGSVDDEAELTVSCTAGEREVYAIVNGPSLASVSTKTALLATTSNLAENNATSFQMMGNKAVTLPQASAITIDVSRMVARIYLKRITRAFTSSALAAKTFTVDEIFITNVAGNTNFANTAEPTIWHNMQGYSSELPHFTHEAPNESITNNSSYFYGGHRFYAYPNAADDTSAGMWCPRRTRLVLKTTLGTDTYYYPITLPVLESNKSYEIENLTLTRPGSDDPDKPVTFQDATFEINVLGWTAVPVTEGITL